MQLHIKKRCSFQCGENIQGFLNINLSRNTISQKIKKIPNNVKQHDKQFHDSVIYYKTLIMGNSTYIKQFSTLPYNKTNIYR